MRAILPETVLPCVGLWLMRGKKKVLGKDGLWQIAWPGPFMEELVPEPSTDPQARRRVPLLPLWQ